MGRKGVSISGAGPAAPPPRRPGWGRVLRRLTAGTESLHAEELRDEVTETGATPISACHDREWVDVTGTLRSVTLQPRGSGLTLEAELWDGTGQVTVVWLGRHEIHGIGPGRHIIVHGRLSYPGGRPTIFNPRYELKPADAE
jgi:hypothetical protein